MKKEINIYSLLSSLVILIVGLVLMTKPDILIGTISWIIGCLLILGGIIRSILSLKNNDLNTMSLYTGIVIVIIGILLITFPEIINVTIKILLGGWILYIGVTRLVFALIVKSVDSKGSNAYLLTSILMLVIGVLVIINFYDLLGLLLVIYAIMDITNYIIYIVRKKDYPNVFETEQIKPKNKRITKAIKEKQAVDADIEE